MYSNNAISVCPRVCHVLRHMNSATSPNHQMWPKDRSQWLATINLGYTPQMRTLIATLTALMLFATTPVAAGDFEDGLAAYDAGNYRKAFQLWKPLAERGDAGVQANIGGMYRQGLGVTRNPVKAFGWYKKSAKQGVADSQAVVGSMYGFGDGVLRDIIQAYAWSNIAAAQGHAGAKVNQKAFGKYIRDKLPSGNRVIAAALSETYWKVHVVPFN